MNNILKVNYPIVFDQEVLKKGPMRTDPRLPPLSQAHFINCKDGKRIGPLVDESPGPSDSER
jgi:hypothetical protein